MAPVRKRSVRLPGHTRKAVHRVKYDRDVPLILRQIFMSITKIDLQIEPNTDSCKLWIRTAIDPAIKLKEINEYGVKVAYGDALWVAIESSQVAWRRDGVFDEWETLLACVGLLPALTDNVEI